MWLVKTVKLSILDNSEVRGYHFADRCPFCTSTEESISHLFFDIAVRPIKCGTMHFTSPRNPLSSREMFLNTSNDGQHRRSEGDGSIGVGQSHSIFYIELEQWNSVVCAPKHMQDLKGLLGYCHSLKLEKEQRKELVLETHTNFLPGFVLH